MGHEPAVVNPIHLRRKKLACVALENMSTHGLHSFVFRRNLMKSHARVVVVGGGVTNQYLSLINQYVEPDIALLSDAEILQTAGLGS